MNRSFYGWLVEMSFFWEGEGGGGRGGAEVWKKGFNGQLLKQLTVT